MDSSGIHVSHFTHGDHICLFYSDLDEQVATVGPYVLDGLAHNERCLCIQETQARHELLRWLSSRGIDAHKEVARGALIFMEPTNAYTYRSDGSLDQEGMLKLVAQSLEDALSAGFSGFRPTGEVVWSLDDDRCAQLAGYERMLDRYLPGTHTVGLCQYDIRRFQREYLDAILSAHKLGLLTVEDSRRTMRIRNGHKFADIVFRENQPDTFAYKVRVDGSADLIAIGQEDSLGAAISRCQGHLRT
jgi:DcmR-like sensory protein